MRPEVLVQRFLLLAGGVVTAVAIVLASFGQWSWVIAVAAGAGGATIAVGARRRTTHRLRTELSRLSDLAERRAEQVAALSHELRTPLSMIKAAAELLLEQTPGPLTAAQRRFLTVIAQQCSQVIGLSEGLLIQARIQAGLFTPRLEPIDVSGLARDVVVAMRPLCAQHRQRITLDAPQVTRAIAADPTLVLQALTNLVSNASRFTSEGGSINVRIMEIDSGIAVYVTDDGAGMTREERRRLFRRFATGRPLADGTGLGLVITKEVIEAHGGSIMVDTTAHRGTTFLFTLPREGQT
ncbi:MAG: sensor histidine kinase [Pseudonocardiaceae bacterium]